MNRPPTQSDVDHEIEFHFQETVDALVASGLNEADARREAVRRFGNRNRHANAMHSAHTVTVPKAVWRSAFWADLVAEVRFAARGLLRAVSRSR